MISVKQASNPTLIDGRSASSVEMLISCLSSNADVPDIVNRVDDSVVRLCNGKKFFIRKSRGFLTTVDVPYFVTMETKKHGRS